MKHLKAKELFVLLLAVVLVVSAGILLSTAGDFADSKNEMDTGSKEHKTATNIHSADTNPRKDHPEVSIDTKLEDVVGNEPKTMI